MLRAVQPRCSTTGVKLAVHPGGVRTSERRTLDLDLTVLKRGPNGPFDLGRPRVSPCVGLCARGADEPTC